MNFLNQTKDLAPDTTQTSAFMRLAVPAWAWGRNVITGGDAQSRVSREELMRLFGSDLSDNSLFGNNRNAADRTTAPSEKTLKPTT